MKIKIETLRVSLNILVLALGLFAFDVNNASADEPSFVLEGKLDDGLTQHSLGLAVSGDRAIIAVKGAGCLGSMEAYFSRIDNKTWVLHTDEDEGDGLCVVTVKDIGNGLVETDQGPGCSNYHGALCGFSGTFRAPTENGLAPIFDPAS